MVNIWMYILVLNQAFSERPLAVFSFFAPIWTIIQSQVSDFANSISVATVTLFWLIDIVTGAIRAIREKEFSPKKFVKGMVRWVFWMAALSVAWSLRISIPIVGGIVASVIESVIIFAEGASILRNLALLSGDERVRKILNVYADMVADKMDEIIPGEENDLHLKDNKDKQE